MFLNASTFDHHVCKAPVFGNIDGCTKEEPASNHTDKARHEERVLHACVVDDRVFVAIIVNNTVGNLTDIKE